MVERRIVLIFHATTFLAVCDALSLLKRKKDELISLMERILVNYVRGRNAGFLSIGVMETHREQNPLPAQPHSY